MQNASKVTIGIANVTCRILVFYFYWLATNGVDVRFDDRRLAFVNEAWTWDQLSIEEISIYNTACPSNMLTLSQFRWPGTTSYINDKGDQVDSISYKVFNKWALEPNVTKPFVLCGLPIQMTFKDYAGSSKTCEERGLKDCGDQGDIEFCSYSSNKCPITSFGFVNDKEVVVRRDNDVLPLSLVRIDSFGVCAIANKTNTYPNMQPDPHLFEWMSHCSTLDDRYFELNSLSDQSYFMMNNASNYQVINENSFKSMYYTNYANWNKTCNGELFNIAYGLGSRLSEVVNDSSVHHFIVMIYLLVCNYSIPSVPFVCRCAGND